MKACSYCGAEYPDDAVMCTIDHTPFERLADPTEVGVPTEREPKNPEYRFSSISAEDMKKNFVTLLSCATLPEAGVIVGRLEAAGIEVFVPDESLMTVTGGCWTTFGSVRVQISPKDYEAAKELLGDIYGVARKE
jgi:hypothetical protein